jgi:hypothetical protein
MPASFQSKLELINQSIMLLLLAPRLTLLQRASCAYTRPVQTAQQRIHNVWMVHYACTLAHAIPLLCVFAGPEASTELSMVELLQSLTPQSLPLLPHILASPATTPGKAAAGAAGAAAAAGAPLSTPQRSALKAAGSTGGGDSSGSDSPSYSPTDSEASGPGAVAGRAVAAAAGPGAGPDQHQKAPCKPSDGCAPRRKGAKKGSGGSGREGRGAEGASSATEHAEELVARFRLNEEQAEVVQHVATWCLPEAQVG